MPLLDILWSENLDCSQKLTTSGYGSCTENSATIELPNISKAKKRPIAKPNQTKQH